MQNKFIQNGIEGIQNPKNYNQFLSTVRRYAERLREEKDVSLKYLNQINHMSQSLRIKDMEIEKLKKVNRQLTEKLSVYNSVLTRSRTMSPMRMSTVIGKNNLTQSIIQTKHEEIQNLKPFEQFFILDLSEIDKKLIKYRYSFQKQNQIFQEVITGFIDNCEGPQWNVQVFGINDSHKVSKSILSIYNSPFTTKKQSQVSSEILSKINPSYYYFLYCIVQKQLISLEGKYCWAPVVYGFISFMPFSSNFFALLEHITSDIKLKSESDLKILDESLQILNASGIRIPQEVKFKFYNKLQVWKIPQNTQEFILSYSIDVLKNFALELVIDILMLLLLQIPITVVSSNQEVLSKFMFYFIFIIKPLKYPFPIIFNLTEKMKTLLQSPFPTFIGTTNTNIIESFLCERAVFDLDKKVAKSWPMIDNLDSSRAFLLSVAHKVGSFQRLSQVTTEIIKGHQYQELQPYWKDFTRTQIYNNYVYHQ